MQIALDHCVIHVSDWERSNAFYRDVLGAEIVPRPVGFAYRFGTVQLNLHGPGFKPAEVARCDSRQEVQADIGRRASMCNDGLRILLEVVRWKPVLLRGYEGREETPGAACNKP